MDIGFIGLGRMGMNMVYNLLDNNYSVVAYNRSGAPVREAEKRGAVGAYSIKELFERLPRKRIIWMMIPARAVDDMIGKLKPNLSRGDILIDGGNSFYRDSIRRHRELNDLGVRFLDVGTSGGIEGARHGACMMVGGDRKAFKGIEALFSDMCVKDGYGYMGCSGAGHFVKMVHNGIEYGMMGAIAEGMDAVRKSGFAADLMDVARVYSNGSIVESRLMSWLLAGMKGSGFAGISGEVPKGETEDEMRELEKTGMPILRQARLMRAKTRAKPDYRGKLIAAMRNQFGGHATK
ncbi:MAG: phosphogluconate dehydrogenase (NAD(+)-dependent, decarboxylating) [archaeon]